MAGIIDGLLVRLGVVADTEEAKEFNGVLKDISRTATSLMVGFAQAAKWVSATTLAMSALAETSSSLTDKVGLMAAELQIDPEVLGRWRAYGRVAGVGAEQVSSAFSKISDAMALAKTQGKGKIFEDAAFLGVDLDVEDSVEQNLQKIQKRVSELYEAGKGADARALLGNLGLQELTPLLSKTKEEMKGITELVEKTGFVTKDDVKNARGIQRALTSTKLIIEDSGRILEKLFGPGIEKFSKILIDLWDSNKEEIEKLGEKFLSVFGGIFEDEDILGDLTTQDTLDWFDNAIEKSGKLVSSITKLVKSVITLGKELGVFKLMGETVKLMGDFAEWSAEKIQQTAAGVKIVNLASKQLDWDTMDYANAVVDDNFFARNLIGTPLKVATAAGEIMSGEKPTLETLDKSLNDNWFLKNLFAPARLGAYLTDTIMGDDKKEEKGTRIEAGKNTFSPSTREPIPATEVKIPSRTIEAPSKDEEQKIRTGKQQSSIENPTFNITIKADSSNPRQVARASRQALEHSVAQYNQNLSNTG